MASATEVLADAQVQDKTSETARVCSDSPHEFRWRVVDDPPPPPKLTRFQRLYSFLYEYNKY